jgi:preprotein translocase subunit SecF
MVMDMVMIMVMHFDLSLVLFCGLMADTNNAYFFAFAIRC